MIRRLTLLFLIVLPVYAQDAPPPAAPNPGALAPGAAAPGGQPAIEPLGGDRFRIGALTIDRKAREVRLPGAIADSKGALEYLACAPGGKLYESLLRADVDPYHFHLALLLIGLAPENNLGFQGDRKVPAGDPVDVEIAWEEDGKRVVRRAEELLWDRPREKSMPPTPWVFTGSGFVDGVFAASMNKSLVAIYNDPTAVLNIPIPEGGFDNIYWPRKETVPATGTVVEVILRAVEKPEPAE
jgi:hypothetical protein